MTQAATAARTRSARPLRWVLEAGLVAAFYAAYAAIRNLHGRSAAAQSRTAHRHGAGVLHVERLLHIDVERGVQRLLPTDLTVVHVVNGFYLVAHVTVTLTVLVVLLARRPDIYARCRNALLLATAVALPIFALWPTAPPRLLPAAHVQNVLAAGGWWSIDHGAIERINDPFAAMPSLHLVWSTWVALAVFTAVGAGRRRLLAFAYPLVVSFVVLATGAHWLLDLVAGAGLTAVSWLLTGLLPSARRLPARR